MAIDRPSGPRDEISWSGWGDPAQAAPLPDGLRQAAQRRPRPAPGRAAPAVHLRAGADPGPAARRARGTRWRRSWASPTPIPITRPAPATPAASRRSTCSKCGGTGRWPRPISCSARRHTMRCSPCSRTAAAPRRRRRPVRRWHLGGRRLRPETAQFAGVVALDLRRLNGLVAARRGVAAGGPGAGAARPEAEALLAPRGYTIGHFPQSWQYATLGGFAAARSSGQASAGYGRFDERVLGLRVATPAGTLTWAGRPSRRPAPICASSCSAPRGPSG